jgi:hypothetical protein
MIRRTTLLAALARPAALAPLLFAWLALPALATGREEVRREFHKTLPLAAGEKLQIQNRHGDVRIRTHAEAAVKIDAVIRVSSSDEAGAEAFSKAIEITAEPIPGGVTVSTRFPEKKWVFQGSGHISYSVDYDIVMPETALLAARNSFGDVNVTGLKAAAEIRNSNGAIAFRDGRGAQKLENSFGNIDLAGNVGDAVIANSNGTVSVADVQGKLDARNRFGRVTLARISGRSDVVNSNGAVSLENSGPAMITNSFGSVTLRNIEGDLTVRNSNGSIDVSGVSGAAELNTSFGGIQFSDMKKSVTCTGNNARVNGARAGEGVKIRNTFGAVELRETGAIDVENSNGKIIVREIRGPAKLTTSFGAIDAMGIAGDALLTNSNAAITAQRISGAVNVQNRFGKVFVSHAKGDVRISTDNSTVTVADVDGPAFVKTSFGLLEVARVMGDLTAENNNGGVKALNVKGGATVRTSFGPVVIQGVGARVDVTNQNGSVDISGLAGSGCQPVIVRSSFAPIRVALPESASYDVTARTSFGKVHTEIPLDMAGEISGENLRARMGKGKCELSLANDNGNIELRRAAPPP